MAILSAGYPIRRMYMKIATAYSASPRFYKNKQDKEWRNCFGNNGFTDFWVRFITISQIRILLCHSKTDICFFNEIQITGLSIQMTYTEGGWFGSYLTPGSWKHNPKHFCATDLKRVIIWWSSTRLSPTWLCYPSLRPLYFKIYCSSAIDFPMCNYDNILF